MIESLRWQANAALVDLFGKQGALEIITKNPGVLACAPNTLATTPKKDIENAANLVSSIDNMAMRRDSSSRGATRARAAPRPL